MQLGKGVSAEVLQLKGGAVLLVSAKAIATYSSRDNIDNPLRSSRIDYAEFPEAIELSAINERYTLSWRSGMVQLHDERILLITPFHASLFANKEDALQGHHPLAQVRL